MTVPATATVASPEPHSAPAALALRAVYKSFGPVQILFDIDFDLRPGEVHALIGENGAGKSTTMKILAGYLSATSGSVELDGHPVSFVNSEQAEDQGVVMIHQEFNLAEQLSVEQNIFLGREIRKGLFLDKTAMRTKTRELLQRLNCDVDPDARVMDISVPDKQMVEIAKALSRKARVLIMDEPTAVLTNRESEVLFEQVDRLRAEGTAILFTSHKLDEVARIADRITIMRDGHRIMTKSAADLTQDQMAEAMVGRELSNLFPPKTGADADQPVLEVTDLEVPGFVAHASFHLRKGEILGFAGLIGSGRTELMEGVVGLRSHRGNIKINGQDIEINGLSDAKRAGVAYLTEDRKSRGLLLDKGMRENLTLLSLEKFTTGLIDRKSEEAALDKSINDFDIRAPTREVLVGNLSGGNQQKLLIAKTMLSEPEVVIIDEPTRGIDIGTKQQIYEFIHTLAQAGKSIIVISSEMSEVIGLADRVVVMRSGRIVGEVEGNDVNEETIVRLAMGLEGEQQGHE
ncbi:sugar ABC transporter ATP-binding protein [Qingshengfaniella alkalisoli]|uniref:Sugar ABC transporter ATP-binding protein n=1 Tax=Qingshengfaniella alkalisoli TaxID=2599296 RepID=A0A5B8IZN4_9RHOB|nr:sugar ABC transporter ATP-binding protein [Qingshengfaniella alkalisoli]QDY71532.1 sugar ABC transporter ATP-binding protein [Qingshengfaniella alkalisoli]